MSAPSIIAACFLFLFNLAFLITQLTVVLFASGKLSTSGSPELDHHEILGVSRHLVFIFLIVVGVIGAAAALLGLLNVFFQEQCLFISYVYFLGLAVVIALGFFITNWLFRDSILQNGRTHFKQLMVKRDPAVDLLQSVAHCCGVDSPTDWHNDSRLHLIYGKHHLYPASCCASVPGHNRSQPCLTPSPVGCFSLVQRSLYKRHGQLFFGGLLGVTLLLMALTCCLELDRQLEPLKKRMAEFRVHLKEFHSVGEVDGGCEGTIR